MYKNIEEVRKDWGKTDNLYFDYTLPGSPLTPVPETVLEAGRQFEVSKQACIYYYEHLHRTGEWSVYYATFWGKRYVEDRTILHINVINQSTIYERII